MTQRRTKGEGGITPRPCLVCETPCLTEGQLCRECADRGHRVTDTEVIVNLDLRIPDSLLERHGPAQD